MSIDQICKPRREYVKVAVRPAIHHNIRFCRCRRREPVRIYDHCLDRPQPGVDRGRIGQLVRPIWIKRFHVAELLRTIDIGRTWFRAVGQQRLPLHRYLERCRATRDRPSQRYHPEIGKHVVWPVSFVHFVAVLVVGDLDTIGIICLPRHAHRRHADREHRRIPIRHRASSRCWPAFLLRRRSATSLRCRRPVIPHRHWPIAAAQRRCTLAQAQRARAEVDHAGGCGRDGHGQHGPSSPATSDPCASDHRRSSLP